MNLKDRLKNKTFILTLSAVLLTFIYNLLGMLSIVPPVSQDEATNVILAVVQVLAGLGILVDPTTPGVTDGGLNGEAEKHD